MLNEITHDNMKDLFSTIQIATRPQLLRFFAGEIEEKFAEDLIDRMIHNRELFVSTQYDTYTVISAPGPHQYSRDAVQRMLDAFWLVAKNFGSVNIRYCFSMKYPMQYYLITEDGDEFDITVVMTEEDARQSMLFRKYPVGTDVHPASDEDPVNHIAIVYSEEMGMELAGPLRRYGFDLCYVYDAGTQDCTLLEI